MEQYSLMVDKLRLPQRLKNALALVISRDDVSACTSRLADYGCVHAMDQRWYIAGPASTTLARQCTTAGITGNLRYPALPTWCWANRSKTSKNARCRTLCWVSDERVVLSWAGIMLGNPDTDAQSKKAVTANFSSEQLLPFDFINQYRWVHISWAHS